MLWMKITHAVGAAAAFGTVVPLSFRSISFDTLAVWYRKSYAFHIDKYGNISNELLNSSFD